MTYAVTAIQATDGEIYYEYDGKIIVRDSNGNVITNEASHIFVSHGKNGIGAYSEGGGVGKLCNDAPVNERRNCDNDGVFVDTLLIGEDFDDYITFNAAQLINAIIPAGAIVPFDRATCPPGWSAYDEAVGRMVIGIGDDQKDPPAGTPFAGDPLDPAVTTTYDIGDTGGSAWRIDSDALTATHNADDGFVQQVLAFYPNLSPYVALLYCRKN